MDLGEGPSSVESIIACSSAELHDPAFGVRLLTLFSHSNSTSRRYGSRFRFLRDGFLPYEQLSSPVPGLFNFLVPSPIWLAFPAIRNGSMRFGSGARTSLHCLRPPSIAISQPAPTPHPPFPPAAPGCSPGAAGGTSFLFLDPLCHLRNHTTLSSYVAFCFRLCLPKVRALPRTPERCCEVLSF